MDTIISALAPSNGVITSVAPGGETLYLVDEKPISDGIRKYLAHLMGHKKTIETSVHARPHGIATDITTKLLVHEHNFRLHMEELAAHEFADPHNVSSLDRGREELTRFIEAIVSPLADYTWAEHVHIDLAIGHDLPVPHAAQGMAMVLVFDSKRGVRRLRFAPLKETTLPSSESKIIHGMTLVARPGNLGMRQIHEDRDRDQAMKLLQSDASLYRWASSTLHLLGNIKGMANAKFGEAQEAALKEASDGLRANLLVLRVRREAVALAQIEAAAMADPASLPFLQNLQTSLQSVRNLSPALNDAVMQIEKELRHDISAIKHETKAENRVGGEEHSAAGSMMAHQTVLPHSPHAMHHIIAEPHPEEN